MIWKIVKWALIISICFILFRMFVTPSDIYCKQIKNVIETIDIKQKNDNADIGFIIPIKYGNPCIKQDSSATLKVSQLHFVIGREYKIKKFTYYFDDKKEYIKRIEDIN